MAKLTTGARVRVARVRRTCACLPSATSHVGAVRARDGPISAECGGYGRSRSRAHASSGWKADVGSASCCRCGRSTNCRGSGCAARCCSVTRRRFARIGRARRANPHTRRRVANQRGDRVVPAVGWCESGRPRSAVASGITCRGRSVARGTCESSVIWNTGGIARACVARAWDSGRRRSARRFANGGGPSRLGLDEHGHEKQ